MKLFKNINSNGYINYATSFYSKKDGKEYKKTLYCSFTRGSEPINDKNSYNIDLKAIVDGEWYDVSLGAFDNKGTVEGKLWLTKQGIKEVTEEDVSIFEKENEPEEKATDQPLDFIFNKEDIPFY